VSLPRGQGTGLGGFGPIIHGSVVCAAGKLLDQGIVGLSAQGSPFQGSIYHRYMVMDGALVVIPL